jgi:UDP-glucose 4-epimerase
VPQDPSGSVKESHPLAPVTDYGRTMAEKEQTAAALCTKRGIQFASARLFNLFGAGQQTSMMTSAVADRLIRIFLELTPPPLRTGPLHTRRDMTDAGDAAEAMVKMTMTRIDGIFNIGTGKALSGRRIVDEMQAILGSDIPVEEGTSTDPMVECIYADISKTSSLLGWNASTPMQTTLKNILDHCRGLVPGLPG